MTPGVPLPLPQVVYRVVEESLLPARVNDTTAQSYGFNDGAIWDYGAGVEGDGRYLRWIQPMEGDLAKQVEYDMDEQDQAWIDGINRERAQKGHPPVSYELFEVLFDKLEKEWFDLVKRMPKKDTIMPVEDSKCAVCDDGECENSNAIVFCDGCNLAVHQDCYGVPYIPEGQWLCRKCTVSPDKPVSCVLCPNSYGAFKQTTTAQWAHLLCAIWVPDTGVSNTVYMEPIDGVENISRNRWKLICYLCKRRVGACIQCANKACFTAFHVTCARERGLSLKMKNGGDHGELRSYCEKHMSDFAPADGSPLRPSDHKRSHNKKKALPPPRVKVTSLVLKHTSQKSSKAARAYKQSYNSGPPVIPAFIYNRVMECIGRIEMEEKDSFVGAVCRYWSLKREARRGAPLLKRLHLEPWTASASSKHQTDLEKAKKLELIHLLRNDLEKLRQLTDHVAQREQKKLERVQLLRTVVDKYIFSKDVVLRSILARIALIDKDGVFALPVSRLQAPDYYDVVKYPMDWATMGEKLDRHEYLTGTDFQDDIELVLNNARRYNKPETSYHKLAISVGDAAEPILSELDTIDRNDSIVSMHSMELTKLLETDFVEDLFSYHFEESIPEPPPPPPRIATPPAAIEEIQMEEEEVSEAVEEEIVVDEVEKVEENAGKTGKKGKGKDKVVVVSEEDASTPKSKGGRKRKVNDADLDPSPAVSRARRSSNIDIPPPVASTSALKKSTTRKAKVEEMDESFSDSGIVRKRARPKGKGRLSELLQQAPRTPVQSRSSTASNHVEEIDKRASFKLFESGWVLPEGSSRRAANSTPIVESRTAKPSKIVSNSESSRKGKAKAVIVDEDGDTAMLEFPEIELEDGGTKQDDTKQEEVEVEEGDVTIGGTAMSPKKKRGLDADGNSFSFVKRKWEARLQELANHVSITKKTKLEDGYLVWAKIGGFPWFPAEIADPADEEGTPQHLLKHRPVDDDSKLLVMFFDDRRSAAWVARKDLKRLGENLETDELLQSPLACPKAKTLKSGAVQALALTAAYEWAISTIETEEDRQAKKNSSPEKKSDREAM